ncbi:MAG: hypothetical protein DHS20C18_32080 [Saprospiraceae bacterium]|nr:MAG: hypothetical protein DHS20C18_32080 [Saprospiraceae bacterium]
MDFSNFFNQFDSQDSIAILFITIIGFLFGLVVGLLLRGSRIRKLRKELKELKQKLTEAEAARDQALSQLSEKEKVLAKAQGEIRELVDKTERLEEEKGRLYNEVYNINTEVESQQASNKAYLATIEDLNNQIIGLKSKNEELSTEIESEDEQVDNVAQMQSLYNATRNQMLAIETKINKLETENQSLKGELDDLKNNVVLGKSATISVTDDGPVMAIELGTDEEELEPEYNPNAEKSVLNEKIIIEEREQDDLTRINGVGPFIQKQLNDIGIFTYEQISLLDQAAIEEVTREIGYFPGRIEKDDWVGQAAALAEQKKNDPNAFKTKTEHPTDTTDLKIIEGIGPKIEQLLKDAGINTWQDLADAEVERLNDILSVAGDRYRIHDPGTWPSQAQLAARGDWGLLAQYQDELKGGRMV